jgi:hypothetical protein
MPAQSANDNPILNNPYEEPNWHYATNLKGELDYSKPMPGRRVFTPDVQTIPLAAGKTTCLRRDTCITWPRSYVVSERKLFLLPQGTCFSRFGRPNVWHG